MSCLTSIQIPKCLSHIHPCTGPLASRSEDSYLTFVHVQFHFHLGHYMHIPSPIMSHLAYNQNYFLCLAFTQAMFNRHVGHENSISAPSYSHITLCMSQEVYLKSIQVPSHPHSGLEIRVLPQSRLPYSCAFSIQIASLVNKGTYICISHQSM